MAWILRKTFRFEAAHRLPFHDGKCRQLHGHSWVGEVEVVGDKLQTRGAKTGMVLDYGDLGKILDELCEQYLDHHYLNLTLKLPNSTSEMVARWVFQYLQPKLPGLQAVIIHETCTASCHYGPKI